MGTSKRGVDSRRRILHPSTGFDQEIRDLRRSSPPASFYRAVVVEVLNDLAAIDDDKMSELKSSVVNPEFLTNVPRNSTIVRIVSNARDRKNSSPIVCYPFTPPHFSLPAKAGEHVWVMFENAGVSTRLGYWLWRISEPDHVDDLNYTHSDRKFDKSGNLSTSEKATGGTNTTPGFPNGGGTAASRTLVGAADYEKIVSESTSQKSFTPEPVPRYTKRAGDTVLQGSNNTLIVLGEDRTAGATKTDDEKKTGSGTIDFVVGRGRFPPGEGEEPKLTAARVVENSRGELETDKNPAASGVEGSDTEGNPDFVNDASRVYASMNTAGDANFGLEGSYPEAFKAKVDAKVGPFVVVKSDEIRIIARKDEDNDINGSVRIVKEGKNGEDLAAFLMLPDGTVQIDGSVIYMGRTGGNGPGPSGSEPYIKFSEYKSQMEEFIGIVNSLMTVFTATFPIPDPPTTGGPSPSLAAALSNEGGVVSAIEGLAKLRAKIDNAASTRIFGE
jgi:hypothetical protein